MLSKFIFIISSLFFLNVVCLCPYIHTTAYNLMVTTAFKYRPSTLSFVYMYNYNLQGRKDRIVKSGKNHSPSIGFNDMMYQLKKDFFWLLFVFCMYDNSVIQKFNFTPYFTYLSLFLRTEVDSPDRFSQHTVIAGELWI